MDKIRMYGLAHCGTCKKAMKHLSELGLQFELVNIRDEPPSPTVILAALNSGIERKRFLNTSGGLYRSGNYKEELPSLSDVEFAKQLSSNPMLIKRPFLEGTKKYLVGYRTAEYDDL